MNRPLTPSLIALAAALALAGCGKAPQTTDNALVDVGNAIDAEDANFSDETPVIEDAADGGAAVTIAAVPKPATRSTETAPLVEASDIEDEIRSGAGIQRIRYGEGWAWTRDGGIVRTADRDGANVAYFRRGENNPFFVQRGDRSYAYQGDRPVREFDRDGRASAPDGDRAREATEAARDARDRRQRAEQAQGRARPDRDGRGPDRPRATPTPSPTLTPTPAPSPTARGPRNPGGSGRWTPRPTPSPQATGTPRRDRDRDRPRDD